MIKGARGPPGLSIKGDRGPPGLSIKGDRGPPGLSIKGDRGPPGPLINGIILDTGFVMKDDIDMGLNEILNLKYPTLPNSATSRSYVDNNKTIIPADNVVESNSPSFKADIQMNNNRIVGCGLSIK